MTGFCERPVAYLPLHELADIRTGIAKGKPEGTDFVEIPYLRVANVQDGRLDLSEIKRLRVPTASVDRYRLKAGDVLLTEGGDIDKLGRGTVWQGQIEPCLHQNHVFAVRPKLDLLDATYLAALAGSDYGRQYFLSCAKRTTNLASINSSQLKAFPVPYRPLGEQQKIAAILTTVDDKLGVIARQISATQTLKQGLMQSLFTRGAGTPDTQGRWHPHTTFQDTELGRIPVGWKVTTLEQVAHVERGKFSARPRNDPRYFEAGDIPFIQTGDIAGATRYVSKSSQFINEEGLSVSRLFPVGTIFITIAANIGDVAMAKMPMACPDSLVGILPSSALCDGMWLYFLLKSRKEYFDSQSTQNAQKNINLQVLRPFAFGLPPLTEQAQIAGYLSSVDDKLDTLTTKHTHYQSLKRGLMQKLLTGEWRVKVDASLVNS